MTPQAKGKSQEYRIVYYLRKLGLKAERIPVSGTSRGFKGDVIAPPYLIEVKRRNEHFNPFSLRWQNFLRAVYSDIKHKAGTQFEPLAILSFKGCRVVLTEHPNYGKPYLWLYGFYVQRLEDFEFKKGG